MNVHQFTLRKGMRVPTLNHNPHLVLVFSERRLLEEESLPDEALTAFPGSDVIFCSTSGGMQGEEVEDEVCHFNLLRFDKTILKTRSGNVLSYNGNSHALGLALSKSLSHEDLSHVLVFSDGQIVNGTGLVKGLQKGLPEGTGISGGMAGDGSRFEKTLVGLNEKPCPGTVVIIGLYGNKIQVANSHEGGWDSFGPDRKITKSKGNVLYELDGKSALGLYKKYLGKELSEGLPGNALLFPLALSEEGEDRYLVRTILSIDEEEQSMTFAGDMPEGSFAKLMKANFDNLVEGAALAGRRIKEQMEAPDFLLMVSCVGRKLVLNHRIDEEVEAVLEAFQDNIPPSGGFFSYGEISTEFESGHCELHNQTMTLTALKELP